MYTVAFADCCWLVVAVTMWVPTLLGGLYKPLVVIVPEDDEPPTTPSTDQVIVPKPAVALNCCVCVNVRTVARGLTVNPAVTVKLVEPVTEPEVAWMVVLPALTPVARPVLLIVATEGALELQVTELVRFCVLPSL
jgi:hypothetical protein